MIFSFVHSKRTFMNFRILSMNRLQVSKLHRLFILPFVYNCRPSLVKKIEQNKMFKIQLTLLQMPSFLCFLTMSFVSFLSSKFCLKWLTSEQRVFDNNIQLKKCSVITSIIKNMIIYPS